MQKWMFLKEAVFLEFLENVVSGSTCKGEEKHSFYVALVSIGVDGFKELDNSGGFTCAWRSESED